jgi:hypothetical protein
MSGILVSLSNTFARIVWVGTCALTEYATTKKQRNECKYLIIMNNLGVTNLLQKRYYIPLMTN